MLPWAGQLAYMKVRTISCTVLLDYLLTMRMMGVSCFTYVSSRRGYGSCVKWLGGLSCSLRVRDMFSRQAETLGGVLDERGHPAGETTW